MKLVLLLADRDEVLSDRDEVLLRWRLDNLHLRHRAARVQGELHGECGQFFDEVVESHLLLKVVQRLTRHQECERPVRLCRHDDGDRPRLVLAGNGCEQRGVTALRRGRRSCCCSRLARTGNMRRAEEPQQQESLTGGGSEGPLGRASPLLEFQDVPEALEDRKCLALSCAHSAETPTGAAQI